MNLYCPSCSEIKKKSIDMIKKHDTFYCQECGTSILLENECPLGRYLEEWKNNAEYVWPIIRPDLNNADLSIPRLFFLYQDCYFSILIGRYNAAIILMGVLLEALMKERIELKLGIYFDKDYGKCLEKIEKEKLMCYDDILFLDKFRKRIRNPYQHSDEKQILENTFIKAWPLEFKNITFKKIKKAKDDIENGKIKPTMMNAANNPILRSITKQEHDKKECINLFNEVYDFVIVANFNYFKKIDYDEHDKKFGHCMSNVKHYKY